MANTTFKGPVTSLNGFIGGANVNAADTQQGGTIPWTVSNFCYSYNRIRNKIR